MLLEPVGAESGTEEKADGAFRVVVGSVAQDVGSSDVGGEAECLVRRQGSFQERKVVRAGSPVNNRRPVAVDCVIISEASLLEQLSRRSPLVLDGM